MIEEIDTRPYEVYTSATVDEVTRALREMERNLVKQQRRLYAREPIVICPQLALDWGVGWFRLPGSAPDPNRAREPFKFCINYGSGRTHRVWTVDVSRKGEKTCVCFALHDQSKKVEFFYDKLIELLRAWAEQHPVTLGESSTQQQPLTTENGEEPQPLTDTEKRLSIEDQSMLPLDQKAILHLFRAWLNFFYRQILPTWPKTELGIEEKSKGEEVEESEPRLELQVKTTVVHYAYKKGSCSQDIAAELLGTTGKTYRKYRDNKWLLSDEEFQEKTGKTVVQYWKEISGS